MYQKLTTHMSDFHIWISISSNWLFTDFMKLGDYILLYIFRSLWKACRFTVELNIWGAWYFAWFQCTKKRNENAETSGHSFGLFSGRKTKCRKRKSRFKLILISTESAVTFKKSIRIQIEIVFLLLFLLEMKIIGITACNENES